MIDKFQLLKILPKSESVADLYVPLLNKAMLQYSILSNFRIAAFIAQIGHESGQLRYLREIGNSLYFKKYDTGSLAKRLGNTAAPDGDGEKYCGRGLIQITGYTNYLNCGEALDIDLVKHPELLEQPSYAATAAAWFWSANGLRKV